MVKEAAAFYFAYHVLIESEYVYMYIWMCTLQKGFQLQYSLFDRRVSLLGYCCADINLMAAASATNSAGFISPD